MITGSPVTISSDGAKPTRFDSMSNIDGGVNLKVRGLTGM